MSQDTTSSETLDSMATRLEEWATDRDSMTPKEMYGANERSVLLRTVAKRLRALSDSPVRPTGDAQGWLDLLATCVSCKKRIADLDELVRCFDCRASYCRSHFPIHFRGEVQEMREEIERLHAERSVVTPPADTVMRVARALWHVDAPDSEVDWDSSSSRERYECMARAVLAEISSVTPPDAVRARLVEALTWWAEQRDAENAAELMDADKLARTQWLRDAAAALASWGDVAPYSEVLAMANAAVEKRGIKDVAALHYIDGYLAAAGEFSGKPGLYEGSYTTWPIYDTPCIPSCRAAGPVTHTRGCHNNRKISPAEAASGNYDRKRSSLSSGTVSE